jgi:methyltransferase
MKVTLAVYLLVVALTAAQRLAELLLSRRNLARLSSASRAADSDWNWGALVVLQSLWLLGSLLEPLARGATSDFHWFAPGLALFLLGAGLRVWCISTLGPSWNARARVDPGLRIVTGGPYRLVRHPNYAGVLLELLGLPLAGGAWWTLALLAPAHFVVLGRRIRGEDRLLRGLPGYAESMGGKGAIFPRRARR